MLTPVVCLERAWPAQESNADTISPETPEPCLSGERQKRVFTAVATWMREHWQLPSRKCNGICSWIILIRGCNMSFFREVWWSFVSTTSVVTLAWVGCTDPAGLLTQPVLPSSVDPGTVCLCTRERGNGWLVEERKLWLLTLWSFFPSFFFFWRGERLFFFLYSSAIRASFLPLNRKW